MHKRLVRDIQYIINRPKPVKLEKIPPFVVRFFPNAEGIKKGVQVRIIRDSKQERFEVKKIELPAEFALFDDDWINEAPNLYALLSHLKFKEVSWFMSNDDWFYKMVVMVRNLNTKESRQIHPAFLCPVRKK